MLIGKKVNIKYKYNKQNHLIGYCLRNNKLPYWKKIIIYNKNNNKNNNNNKFKFKKYQKSIIIL